MPVTGSLGSLLLRRQGMSSTHQNPGVGSVHDGLVIGRPAAVTWRVLLHGECIL